MLAATPPSLAHICTHTSSHQHPHTRNYRVVYSPLSELIAFIYFDPGSAYTAKVQFTNLCITCRLVFSTDTNIIIIIISYPDLTRR